MTKSPAKIAGLFLFIYYLYGDLGSSHFARAACWRQYKIENKGHEVIRSNAGLTEIWNMSLKLE